MKNNMVAKNAKAALFLALGGDYAALQEALQAQDIRPATRCDEHGIYTGYKYFAPEEGTACFAGRTPDGQHSLECWRIIDDPSTTWEEGRREQ